jgi:hypothetical protein
MAALICCCGSGGGSGSCCGGCLLLQLLFFKNDNASAYWMRSGSFSSPWDVMIIGFETNEEYKDVYIYTGANKARVGTINFRLC